MRSNAEIRQDAWKVMRSKWLWRLLAVGAILNLIAQTANQAVSRAFGKMNIQTWTDFMQAKVKAMQGGLGYTVPSAQVAWQMTGASSFELFIAYIFTAIVAFGFAGAALKAVGNAEERWFSDSFGGFKRPLELAGLAFLMNLLVMLWSLFLFFPGLVAIYRYRQSWYLKSEHPDWSAWKCIAASGRMMKGYKWRAFCFDLSYLWWLLLAALTLVAAVATGGVGDEPSLTGMALGGIGLYLMLFVFCYFFTGRAAFYRELQKETDHAAELG